MAAGHHDGLIDDARGEIIAHIGDPAFAPDAQPFAAIEGILLEFVELGAGIALRGKVTASAMPSAD
jgi:hypothetical protein